MSRNSQSAAETACSQDCCREPLCDIENSRENMNSMAFIDAEHRLKLDSGVLFVAVLRGGGGRGDRGRGISQVLKKKRERMPTTSQSPGSQH